MKTTLQPSRGTKGVPAELPSVTLSQNEQIVGLNFKVSSEFRREFKMRAAEKDMSMVELLDAAFVLYKESQK